MACNCGRRKSNADKREGGAGGTVQAFAPRFAMGGGSPAEQSRGRPARSGTAVGMPRF